MRPFGLVAAMFVATSCGRADHRPAVRSPPTRPPVRLVRTPIETDAWISAVGRGPGGRPVSTHFLHVAITFDPALGMHARFLNYESEPEWTCTPRGALWVDHGRHCFVQGTCPGMIALVTGFEWDLADLIEIASGGAPHPVPDETLVDKRMYVGCSVESAKPPLHSWLLQHAIKFAANLPGHTCPTTHEVSYSMLHLPYNDDLTSVSFDWGERKPFRMDPTQVDLTPPAGYAECPPSPGRP